MVVFYQVLLMFAAWVLGAILVNLAILHRRNRTLSTAGYTGEIRKSSQRIVRGLLGVVTALILIVGWLSYLLV